MNNHIPHIFLSYAREDFERVVELYDRLHAAGFKPWMDKRNILPGERWEHIIWKAVRRSDFFLICLSASSVSKRGFLQKEIREALNIWKEKLEDDIYLIPVRLDESEIPAALSEFEWVNMYEESGWHLLVQAISTGMERNKQSYKVQTSSGEIHVKTENVIKEKSNALSLKSFLTHPLVIFIAFIGGYLTHHYSFKQKEFDYPSTIQQQEMPGQQNFSNELNKIRLQEIKAVWEQIDKTEVKLDNLLDRANKPPNLNMEDFVIIKGLIEKDIEVINRNRFWLGVQNYNRIQNYLDLNRQYAVGRLLSPPDLDLSDIFAKRAKAKQDILQIRESMRAESQPDE